MQLIARFAFFICALLVAAAAGAQAWPARPLNMIVPYAAGGNVDAVARWVGPELAKRLGQPVVVENVAGAGGVIGTERAARASANGYSILLSVESTIIAAKLVSPSIVKYDGLKDFQPITLLATAPLVLVGKPALAPNTLDELLQLLRAQPGKLNYATSGVGTSLHIAGEMINQQGGVQMTHVPYKAGAQIVTELMGNQVDLAVLPVPLIAEQVRSGKVKAYAVTEPQRLPALPNIPSTAESRALKAVDVSVWFGLFAPAGAERAIITRIHQEAAEILKQDDIREKFANFGMRTAGLGPEEFSRFLVTDFDKFSAVVRAAGIRAE